MLSKKVMQDPRETRTKWQMNYIKYGYPHLVAIEFANNTNWTVI